MSAGLSGTGLVADDLYLMGHHEVSGKPYVQPRALGTGLAGALLAELMLSGSISLRHDGAVVPARILPGDELARQVLDQIAGEHEPYPVRDWLLYLARTAAEDVARRLERAGFVRRSGGRGRRRCGRWVPVDPDWAFSPLLRVRAALDPARPCTARQAALTGLADACGLSFRLAQYASPPGRSPQEAAGHLDPGLRELIAQTQAATGSAVLAHRL
jgi:Golgi phosphoprotein 3 (GPP34)